MNGQTLMKGMKWTSRNGRSKRNELNEWIDHFRILPAGLDLAWNRGYFLLAIVIRGGSMGGMQGMRTPREDDLGFLK